VKSIERRIETPPASPAEKYTGLLPALFRNSDHAPKEEANWRPGTVTYVATPTPSPTPAAAPAPLPPAPPKESAYQTKPRNTALVNPPRSTQEPAEWLSVPKLLSVLKESDTPAQREWAADCIAGANCASHPEIVPAVLSASKTDSSPIVRIACIHTLDKVHAHGPDVIMALNVLTNDPDPNVRKEAAQAMSHLAGK
jgi:hypothetical protein